MAATVNHYMKSAVVFNFSKDQTELKYLLAFQQTIIYNSDKNNLPIVCFQRKI